MFVFRNWQGVYLGQSGLRSTREDVGVSGRLETGKAELTPPLLETTEEHAFASALLNRSNWGRSGFRKMPSSLFLVLERSVYRGPAVCAHPDIVVDSAQESERALASSCWCLNVVGKAVIRELHREPDCVTPLERFQGLWVHFRGEK